MFPGNSLKIQPQQAYTLCCGVFVYREGNVQARFQAGYIMNNVFEKMRRNRIGTVIGSILLVAVLFFGCACREISRDRDAIICALNNEFGSDAYTLVPENYFFPFNIQYVVTLHAYPEAPFTIWRGYSGGRVVPPFLPWLIGEEEHIYYDYRRPIGELAVADYCATYQIPNPVVHGLRGGDVEEHHLNAWNNGIFEFQVNASSVAEVEPYYREAAGFARFLEAKYPVLVNGRGSTIDVTVIGLHLKGYSPNADGRWPWHTEFTVYESRNGTGVIESWETVRAELLMKVAGE
jgi:hypothetical protein